MTIPGLDLFPGGLPGAPLGGLPGPPLGGLPGPPLGVLPVAALDVLAGATRIIVLKNAVEVEELKDATEYSEIMQDMREECSKYGTVQALIIPRPTADAPSPPGLGLIIVEYDSLPSAAAARQAMHGRKFGGHIVEGTFLSEADYGAGHFH